jgi:hypothetical protein
MDSVSFTEPEPINDHRCFGPNCPSCKRRSRVISHPDSTRTPNHHCMGPGCPRCNTKRRFTSMLQTRSTLHKCNTKRRGLSVSVHKYAFQLVSSYEASPLFSRSAPLSNPDMPMTGSSHNSEPEPPHRCTVYPCSICGKGKTWKN